MVPPHQRADGSWPMQIVDGVVDDASGETNFCAYLAVGVWHHWLITGDAAFVEQMWPTVRRALDFVVGLQLPVGEIAWSQEWPTATGPVTDEALLTGSSSIYHSLRCALALAELVGRAAAGVGARRRPARPRACAEHREPVPRQAARSRWTGTTRCSAARVRGAGRHGAASTRAGTTSSCPASASAASTTSPWVTGAETCELVLALDALGDRDRALELLADMQHLRDEDGSYWTGYVLPRRQALAGGAAPPGRRPR